MVKNYLSIQCAPKYAQRGGEKKPNHIIYHIERGKAHVIKTQQTLNHSYKHSLPQVPDTFSASYLERKANKVQRTTSLDGFLSFPQISTYKIG